MPALNANPQPGPLSTAAARIAEPTLIIKAIR
jgi:hypothetical protein